MAKDYDFNSYAAGNKVYGLSGRPNPTNGPLDRWGYIQRDRAAKIRRQALLNKLQAIQKLRGNQYGVR